MLSRIWWTLRRDAQIQAAMVIGFGILSSVVSLSTVAALNYPGPKIELSTKLVGPKPGSYLPWWIDLPVKHVPGNLKFEEVPELAPLKPESNLGNLIPLPRRDPRASYAGVNTEEAIRLSRQYLVRIASAGGTMEMVGRDKSIGWMHPEYVLRAARIAKRARAEGIHASCASAYRPYGLGIGGFHNKRNSRHTFGLACDWADIGGPGSRTAIRFYQIAKEEGLCNPYGPHNRAEWNHYQLDCGKIVPLNNRIQKTVNAKGPINPESMWKAGEQLVGGIKSTIVAGLNSIKGMAIIQPATAEPIKIAQRSKKKGHHHIKIVKKKHNKYAGKKRIKLSG